MDNKTIAKKTVKLLDYISGNKTYKGDEVFVNPCPICGHNDHFSVNPTKNIYISHSGCCRGGSIIDWFIESEKMTLRDSVKHVIALAGLEDKKISPVLINKNRTKMLQFEFFTSQKALIVRRCYHKLTQIERALREMEDKDAFLNWFLSFLERYTSRFVETKNPDKLYELCLNFKDELHYSYTEFIRYEHDLIEVIENFDKLKLHGGI